MAVVGDGGRERRSSLLRARIVRVQEASTQADASGFDASGFKGCKGVEGEVACALALEAPATSGVTRCDDSLMENTINYVTLHSAISNTPPSNAGRSRAGRAPSAGSLPLPQPRYPPYPPSTP